MGLFSVNTIIKATLLLDPVNIIIKGTVFSFRKQSHENLGNIKEKTQIHRTPWML